MSWWQPRALGRSGISVSRLGLGSSYGLSGRDVERAVERGVNYLYWGSRRRDDFGDGIARAARRDRDKLCIVVQSYSRSAADTRSCSIFRPRPIAEAVRRRTALAQRTDLTAYRLVHGAADGTPGLAVDRFEHVVVIHADSADDLAIWRDELEEELDEFSSAYVKFHPPGASRLSDAVRREAR